ncbi:hypothetical protein CPter91_2153 [Collimonas pratensis]|uniref:Uncharacterized protein n=1 Tax=Collimonas pratensis TaxID=279113 RepID=A0A127Q3B6_9BURK|nr:hypothetical protein CPter91_2153 [Collimonas pratensis]
MWKTPKWEESVFKIRPLAEISIARRPIMPDRPPQKTKQLNNIHV